MKILKIYKMTSINNVLCLKLDMVWKNYILKCFYHVKQFQLRSTFGKHQAYLSQQTRQLSGQITEKLQNDTTK